MSEEVKEVVEPTIEEIQAERIRELEEQVANGADPEELKKARQAYKNLLKQTVDRRPAPKEEPKQLRPAAEIGKQLATISDGDVTNKRFWELSLEYRDSFMAETGKDPWTDGATEATPKTNFIAETVKKLISDSTSDSTFNAQFNDLLRDDPAVVRALREKNKKKK